MNEKEFHHYIDTADSNDGIARTIARDLGFSAQAGEEVNRLHFSEGRSALEIAAHLEAKGL